MFFSALRLLEATIFSKIADPGSLVEPVWSKSQPGNVPTRTLLEGPRFAADGSLYCVDVLGGRIVRFDRNGACETVVRYHGWPNGLKFGRDGRAYIADYMHGIKALDLESNTVTPLVERYDAERFRGVNDLFFARNGNLYFTDQGFSGLQDPSGRVFRLTQDGRLDCVLDGIPSPNGLVMNLDESALYVAVTRANAVWRVPFMKDGRASKVGTFIQLSGGTGPDGLALDSKGGVVIAHTGMGCVWVTDIRGEPTHRIVSPVGDHTTNVAFGGEGNRTLFIIESGTGTILKAELDVPGQPMYSQQH